MNFVLVHGAWGGSWMWQRLARVLRTAGHEVYTPSLTGIGERAHLATPDTDLSTHIADVLGTIRSERLEKLVLVGHSYGGMVVTGVADREPERVGTLVYLDAFVPQHGQAMVSLTRPQVREAIEKHSGPIAPLPPAAQGMTDAKEIAWLDGRRDPQPRGTLTQPISLKGAYKGPRVYIFCSGYQPTSFASFAERTRSDPAWKYHELKTHHYPHVSMPSETAGVLLNYA